MATSAAAPSATTPSSASVVTPAAVSSAPSGGAQNLIVPADVRAQILAGYLAKQGFAADQIGGTAPGSVYYAYVPSTNTYWAAATFVASASATEQTKVTLQDEGSAATFTRVGTGPWDVRLHPLLWPCPGDLPASVLAAWQLTIVEGCAS